MDTKHKDEKAKTGQQAEIPPEVQAHSHAPKDQHVRTLSVIACAKAWHDGAVNYDEALQFLRQLEEGYAYKAMAGHHKQTLQRIWDHFCREGDVRVAAKSGRPHA